MALYLSGKFETGMPFNRFVGNSHEFVTSIVHDCFGLSREKV
jgi:hypothetical protein